MKLPVTILVLGLLWGEVGVAAVEMLGIGVLRTISVSTKLTKSSASDL